MLAVRVAAGIPGCELAAHPGCRALLDAMSTQIQTPSLAEHRLGNRNLTVPLAEFTCGQIPAQHLRRAPTLSRRLVSVD